MRILSSRTRALAALVHNSLFFSLALLGVAHAVLAEATGRGDAAAATGVHEAYGKLPLQFEANRGQTDSRVKFLSRGSGYSLFLTSTEAVLTGREPKTTLRMRLAGANEGSQIEGIEELPGKVNYFIGNDPKKWRTHVPTYGKVRYANVYPGVDLVYQGNQRQIEYDFVVAPAADPGKIALSFVGAKGLTIDPQGDLVVETAGSQIRIRKPFVYQDIGGTRQEVSGRFILKAGHRIGFHVGVYDRGRPLIIDPVLVYSTYLGGSYFDVAVAIAADATGNAYVTGYTSSTDFPTVNALQSSIGLGQSAFVSKLNPSGSAFVYSTYLGANGYVAGLAIAADATGNAYVTGQTTATDFPTVNPFQATMNGFVDAFVLKLNPTGSALVFSTYLGGTGGDAGTGIAVDGGGFVYVTGGTTSADFPTRDPFQAAIGGTGSAFVSKLDPGSSSLVYSTYLGGMTSGLAIAVDGFGNAYVGGQAQSNDFPVTPGAFQAVFRGGSVDGFLAKLNAAGSALLYATYLGGSGFDQVSGVAVSALGDAYVTGYSDSANFPTRNALQKILSGPADAFVAGFNAAGSVLFSTYLGGSDFDSGNGIALDSFGNVYVTGGTGSTDFPTVDALQPGGLGGTFDAFVVKMNPAGSSLIYSTFFGGSGEDLGIGLATDARGRSFVTGQTNSVDFPTVNALQATYPGGFVHGFVTRLDALDDVYLHATAGSPPILVLNGAFPISTTAKFKDSTALKFAGGNPWADVGTWTVTPPPSAGRTLTGLGGLHGWIGVKNSDDIGTRFDLRIALRKNGVLIAEGSTLCIQGVPRDPAAASAVAVPFGAFSPVTFSGSDELSLTVFARIGTNPSGGQCPGHGSAVGLRLYFDSTNRASRFATKIDP